MRSGVLIAHDTRGGTTEGIFLDELTGDMSVSISSRRLTDVSLRTVGGSIVEGLPGGNNDTRRRPRSDHRDRRERRQHRRRRQRPRDRLPARLAGGRPRGGRRRRGPRGFGRDLSHGDGREAPARDGPCCRRGHPAYRARIGRPRRRARADPIGERTLCREQYENAGERSRSLADRVSRPGLRGRGLGVAPGGRRCDDPLEQRDRRGPGHRHLRRLWERGCRLRHPHPAPGAASSQARR